jgi:CrcB protein
MLQNPAIRSPLAVSLGAIAGALSRYYIGVWLTHHFGTDFPYGTFVANLTGCLGMGFFATLALDQVIAIAPDVRLLVATGFLGAYTTFSSYELDTGTLLVNDRPGIGLVYWFSSIVLGVISLQLGIVLANVILTKHKGNL